MPAAAVLSPALTRAPVGMHLKVGSEPHHALVRAPARAARIVARGVVVHTGSRVEEGAVAPAMRRVREGLLPLLDGLDRHPAVGVCLDTCHALAAGEPLDEAGGPTRVLDRLVAGIGPGRLRLVHVNDSKDPRGSRRDRHERVGEGHLGMEPFRELLRHPALDDVPLVLETPGAWDADDTQLPLLLRLREEALAERASASGGRGAPAARTSR